MEVGTIVLILIVTCFIIILFCWYGVLSSCFDPSYWRIFGRSQHLADVRGAQILQSMQECDEDIIDYENLVKGLRAETSNLFQYQNPYMRVEDVLCVLVARDAVDRLCVLLESEAMIDFFQIKPKLIFPMYGDPNYLESEREEEKGIVGCQGMSFSYTATPGTEIFAYLTHPEVARRWLTPDVVQAWLQTQTCEPFSYTWPYLVERVKRFLSYNPALAEIPKLKWVLAHHHACTAGKEQEAVRVSHAVSHAVKHTPTHDADAAHDLLVTEQVNLPATPHHPF